LIPGQTIVSSLRAAMIKLTDAIRQHPTQAFLTFLVLHAVVWTVLPALFFINLPLDLIEGLVYGREWQLGYDKLPPLPWWMLEATYRLFGPDLFFYALSQLTVLATFALIWVMARQLVGPVGALVAILIIDGMHGARLWSGWRAIRTCCRRYFAPLPAMPRSNLSLRCLCTLVRASRRSAGRCCGHGPCPGTERRNNRASSVFSGHDPWRMPSARLIDVTD
jgi:hypothetical protein